VPGTERVACFGLKDRESNPTSATLLHPELLRWASSAYALSVTVSREERRSYLPNYLGWFRALDRNAQSGATPIALLALAIGA
jgi:hypothetical protein